VLHRLERADRAAELLARLRVLDGHARERPRGAERVGREHHERRVAYARSRVGVAREPLGGCVVESELRDRARAVGAALVLDAQARGGEVLARGPAVAGAVARAREAGTVACAAQLLGAGRALLEASVLHARQRSQFGRPIGSFQAVKHQLADVAIGLEFARPLLGEAAVTLSPRDVSAAKVACTGAAQRAARAALQVHGAIGYTQEHDLHLWLTKVRALAGAWGSQAGHRARLMAAIADGGLAWN